MEIGIYSIFIGNYTCMYEGFMKNIITHFLPNHSKKFYIVTDDENLPKFHDNTEFFYTELIGFPYETLYRFKYFLQFKNVTSDIIYFLNSNSRCMVPITDILPDESGYVFTLHNQCGQSLYIRQFFDKNPISTAYVPPSNRIKFVKGKVRLENYYKYIGGRFYGATRDKYLELCVYLDKKVEEDEKNNYIALWYDESHLNNYVNLVINGKVRYLDDSYHVPEEDMKNFKDIKILYLDKNKIVKNISVIKKQLTNGSIIKNKYNEKALEKKFLKYSWISKTISILLE